MKSNWVGLQRDFTGFLIYCILHFLNNSYPLGRQSVVNLVELMSSRKVFTNVITITFKQLNSN